ncbi:SDR family NAD(P)-dependent oxidoreductase [Sphingomonas sp. CL5.1]|uniref:SDR family NAD(P)-dependent oxidoreductase n=1 Tax=Sphingomonas sp. CL5.1 TaxID=2653203 RepID=UPI00158278F3|nr:SDR family NAD(P)-dependent oxidoreductase [Sphingomonas sp. CL5.1]QKR99321.1 SDR family NAD(P)-dependent oxidoreductase [Sphingomonas sp. CL5.1]
MSLLLSGRTAIVTGAGAGLGRAHAMLLARHGARVLVNDLSAEAAETVTGEIRAMAGDAIAFAASVTDETAVAAMIDVAIAHWGTIDILVCNAGILRDKSFAKMDLNDFRLVLDVHLMGAAICAKAVWDHMRERQYGRIVFTTSSSGLYGNFGQSNYGAAKMALVGLMQTLAIEGQRHDIRVNCLAPSAATGMTEGIFAAEDFARLDPGLVSPAVVALCADEAPTRRILLAGAGSFEQAHITMTRGIHIRAQNDVASELLRRLDDVADRLDEIIPESGFEQFRLEVAKAAAKEE